MKDRTHPPLLNRGRALSRIRLSMAMVALCAALSLCAADICLGDEGGTRPPVSILVLEFHAGAGATAAEAEQASAVLHEKLAGDALLVPVSPQHGRELTHGVALPTGASIDSVGASRFGRATGISLLATGRMFRVQDELMLLGKVMSTETSQIFGAIAKSPKGEPLERAVERLAAEIRKGVSRQYDRLKAPPKDIAQFRAKVERLFRGSGASQRMIVTSKGEPVLERSDEFRSFFSSLGIELVEAAPKDAIEPQILLETETAVRQLETSPVAYEALEVGLKVIRLPGGTVLYSGSTARLMLGTTTAEIRDAQLRHALWQLLAEGLPRVIQQSVIEEVERPLHAK